MTYPKLKLDTAAFLREVWQTKPLVIKQGFANFVDPIDEHDLAGLAQEDEIDSRIVSLNHGLWSVTQGPFQHFDQLCTGKWTLMVQGVDKWIDELNQLAGRFNFIPNWRFDDVMVSYSVPDAGVGPHVDQYDVFLLQGKGKRHWQVGLPSDLVHTTPHQLLQQVADFEPIIDVFLEPGDILYIPPGFPHCGKSVHASMTYSIGFRAPNARDLLQAINDGIFNHDSLKRFSDANRTLGNSQFDVSSEELIKLTELVKQAFDSRHWLHALMLHLSDQQLPLIAPEKRYNKAEVEHFLAQGKVFSVTPGCRPLVNVQFPDEIFINGQSYCLANEFHNTVLAMFASAPGYHGSLPNDSVFTNILLEWLNKGIVLV